MLLRFARPAPDSPDPDGSRDITDDVTESDYLPYACHFDPATLLTKNGELMQVIRITTNRHGLPYEDETEGAPSMREAIRASLLKHAGNETLAFWFHTLRRRRPILRRAQFRERFAARLSEAWNRQQHWQHFYVNEIYVTLLKKGRSADLFDFKEARSTAMPWRNRKHHLAFTANAAQELQAVTEKLLASLSEFSDATLLSIAERPDGMFSEPLEFVHHLVNLYSSPVPVQDVDASTQITSGELTFGFDALEARAENGKRRFAAILSLKGYHELPVTALDRCLQLPEEVIVTQTFNFSTDRKQLDDLEKAREVLENSLDPFIPAISGMSAKLAADRKDKLSFGDQQTTLMIASDQYRSLDEAVGRVQNAFSDIGVITVREDIRLEECFWSQLPGNFEFLRRKTLVDRSQPAGYMRLNHFSSGQQEGNHWGDAVATLPTELGTPYFFNFHVGDVGHTVLLDFNAFADERGASLLNFLLANSRKFDGKLFIMDRNYSARPLVKSLGGQYGEVAPGQAGGLALNPLTLEDTRRNRAFLVAWLLNFLRCDEADADQTRELLREVLDAIYTLPPEQRLLQAVLKEVETRAPGLVDPASGPLQRLFTGVADELSFTQPVCAVELEKIATRRELAMPVFSYLLHRMILALDGSPAIIVLHEAWDLLDNDFFTPRIASLLDMLRQNNAMMIFTTRHFEERADSYLTEEIMRHAATRIVLPDDVAVDYFHEQIGIGAQDLRKLARMERQKGQFLVRHGSESVPCHFTVEELEEFRHALSGDAGALRLMQIQQR